MEHVFGETVVKLVLGDITAQECDAIVNAANPTLQGGGGVDGAIHRVGGPTILEECNAIRAARYPAGLPIGEAVATSAGNLKAKYVIHTVGPIWRGGGEGEGELLSRAYRSSFDVASSLGVRTIAFPSISTGAYGFPVSKASRIALDAAVDFILKGRRPMTEVRYILFSGDDLRTYEETLDQMRTPIG
jgi:O-acetyl-ADP-ribose deacetylase (regulator of RNase III)